MRHHLLHCVPDTETNRHNRLGLVLDLVPIVAAHGNKHAVLRNRVHLDSDIRQVGGKPVPVILNGFQFLFFGIRKLINHIGDHIILSKIDTPAITEPKDMEEYNLQKEGFAN